MHLWKNLKCDVGCDQERNIYQTFTLPGTMLTVHYTLTLIFIKPLQHNAHNNKNDSILGFQLYKLTNSQHFLTNNFIWLNRLHASVKINCTYVVLLFYPLCNPMLFNAEENRYQRITSPRSTRKVVNKHWNFCVTKLFYPCYT